MKPSLLLTINMQIVLDDSRGMRRNLTGVRALVADLRFGNLQTPIVRVLIVDRVSRVATVCDIAHRQQLQFVLAD